MSDVEAPVENLSTTLEPESPTSPSGGGAPKPDAAEKVDEPAKPASLRDVIAEESKKSEKPDKSAEKPAKGKPDDAKSADGSDEDEDGKAKDKAAKGDDKDKPQAKAKGDDPDVKARAEDSEGSEADKGGDDSAKDSKPSDDKSGRIDPPSKFLPDAKETWRNTPRAVQRDVANLVKQHETELAQAQKASERYQSLRQFDEIAQSNGRDLKDSLAKMSEIEDLMQANPYAGLNAILREVGPRKPDGSSPTLYEVAQFVVQQGPDKWQQLVSQRPQNGQQPQQQRQPDPEVVQLKQQLAQMQAEQTTASIIEPFKKDHPRYDELKQDIAFFLKSGRIPTSLSMPDRLAAAYDMAARINPPSHDDAPGQKANPDPERRGESDSSGSKSIKSAPGSVSQDHAPARGGSIRDVLESETKRRRTA